jgi:DNA-binding SARP family transcriptional activator/streptogramin lyase
MEYRILGPLEVFDRGVELRLGGRQQRALLALLLLRRNTHVSTDRMIDELWGERSPPTAAKIVRNLVASLRKTLGDDRLVTRRGGYELRVGAGELDLDRFELLLAGGRGGPPDEDAVEAALALWRGEPLTECGEAPFVAPERARLEDLHLRALEAKLTAAVERGDSADLVGEIEHLVARYPLRERLHALLMLALYRADRQAEALEAYRRARRILTEELGLEPGRSLQELERKILNQDETLATRTPEPTAGAQPVRRRRRRGPVVVGAIAAVVAAGGIAGVLVAQGGSAPVLVKANSLAAIDPVTGRVVADTALGKRPLGLASNGRTVWVAVNGDRTLARIDARSGRLVRTIGIGAAATDVALGTGSVWVVTANDHTVVAVSPAYDAITATRRLGNGPGSATFAVAFGARTLWVGTGDAVIGIDPRSLKVVRRVAVGYPSAVAYGEGSIWEAGVGEDVVRIAPSGARLADVTVGSALSAIAIGARVAWVTAGATRTDAQGEVWRIDTGTSQVLGTTPLGGPYADLEGIAAGAGAIWVTDYAHGTLTRIDPGTGRITRTITLGHHPNRVAVDGRRVWVTVD